MSKKYDELATRMKALEATETHRYFDSSKPIYVRLDGRGFSKFTQGMDKPFDARMSSAMIETTKYLIERNHACIGYTQSDEMSLIFKPKENGTVIFGGKVQKLVSVLASMAATKFHSIISHTQGLSQYANKLPHFDCRAIEMPTEDDACDMLLFREQDAERNAVSMAAQSVFSHSELQKKSKREMVEMLAARGIVFEDYPVFYKRGTYLRRTVAFMTLSEEDRMSIPEIHRPPADMKFERSVVSAIAMPRFQTMENKLGVIFGDEDPK